MWTIIKDKYNLTVKRYNLYIIIMCINFFYNCEVVNRIQVFLRSTVQMLLAILDSDGVARRKAHRMKR